METNAPNLLSESFASGTVESFLKTLRQHRDELQARFHVKSLWLFGSRVRDDYQPDSDLDILVEFDQPIGLEFVSLHDLLEEWLGVKVDLVSKKAVIQKPRLWAHIEKDLVHV